MVLWDPSAAQEIAGLLKSTLAPFATVQFVYFTQMQHNFWCSLETKPICDQRDSLRTRQKMNEW